MGSTRASLVPDMDPVQVLADSRLFRSADRSSLEDLRPVLEWVVLERDEFLSRDAAHGRDLYVLAQGRLDVSLTDVAAGGAGQDGLVVATLVPGDIVGEMQAFAGQEVVMAFRAHTSVLLVKLAQEGLDHYLAAHPRVAERLRQAVTPRFYHRQLVMVLNEMFGDLNPAMMADLERRAIWHHVPREGMLFWQGESSDRVFLVISGRLQVISVADGDEPRVLEELVQGGAAGVGGVLTRRPQAASVFAIRDSVLLEFTGTDFRNLAEQYPTLNRWLVRLLSERLHGVSSSALVDRPNTNVVLVPASGDPTLDELARSLCEVLARSAKCQLVSRADAAAALGTSGNARSVEGSPEDLRLQAWLDRREGESEYVILLADPEVTNWTERCIRQADEVIIIASASDPGRLSKVEERIQLEQRSRRTRMRTALILLHTPDTTMPSGTARWLGQRSVDRHLHMRQGLQSDLERIARYVLRRESALVLGGGGARGFAHIGVIKAIREADLPIDLIVGVSMGALVGARHALAGDTEAMLPLIRKELTWAFRDYTLPIFSLMRGHRFDRTLKTLVADTRIEDLWTPYYCLSSNLTRADSVVHSQGSLLRAIRASSSLPGILPAVADGGDLHVDGSLTNNLPVDVAREYVDQGPVIAVDVVPPVELETQLTELGTRSAWRVALNRLNPFATSTPIPDIVSVLQRAAQLSSLQVRRTRLNSELTDVYIAPPVEEFRILDFSVAEEAADLGYEHAVTAIGDWLKGDGASAWRG